ncbi:hypothetical protein K435DRAFT_849399 [Dendrothele bispora CBS 962.96]|uniref:Uncharacterized protein n=1 Tax=Dendrothele bispora (strain CBS 962.96) TaxID=1314807 RepID=A0A4S8MS23_DENBC|nr:hypothetical protein K435DRAFT_849399 [Dendrothele bispora CBS 962.96]
MSFFLAFQNLFATISLSRRYQPYWLCQIQIRQRPCSFHRSIYPSAAAEQLTRIHPAFPPQPTLTTTLPHLNLLGIPNLPLRFLSLFSNDFGPSALLYPSLTLTNRMNYSEASVPHNNDHDGSAFQDRRLHCLLTNSIQLKVLDPGLPSSVVSYSFFTDGGYSSTPSVPSHSQRSSPDFTLTNSFPVATPTSSYLPFAPARTRALTEVVPVVTFARRTQQLGIFIV